MKVRVPEATATPYVVEVEGEVDIATVGDLEEPVIGAIERGRRPVILDLSDCGFIDSSGIRLLLRAQHALSGNGAGTDQLVVIARDQIVGILRVVALDKVIHLVGTRAEAERRLDLPTPA